MAEAIIHLSRGEKRVEKIDDKKASQSEDAILQINDEEALLFDKPKTKSRSQSKSSKSSKPAALGKAPLPLQPQLLQVLWQRLELVVVLVVTLRLKFQVYYRSLGLNRKRPTVV